MSLPLVKLVVGSGSKNDAGTVSAMMPNERPGGGSTAVNRATGLPARAIVTLSPRSTRASNSDNRVFASCTLTCVLMRLV